jgi:hypothetical protein
MLRIVNLEEIHGLLLRIPSIVDELERKVPHAIGNVREWLMTLEQVLENNRLPLAGNIAALRGGLDSAFNGVIPAGIEFHGRVSSRKIREAAATEMLKRASDLVTSAVQADGARIDEAQRVARQLIALARFKGLIPANRPAGDPIENIKSVWNSMQSDTEIGQGAAHLIGLVGPHDALIVLDRGITRDVWGR